jgi:DNA ligase-1
VTLLAALVETSERLQLSRARLVKVRELAALLRTLEPTEIELAAHYLAGELPQGRIGVGYAQLAAAAQTPPGAAPTLTLGQLDQSLRRLTEMRGRGSAAQRAAALGELFGRATGAEQSFLLPLMAGELRHGALAGIMSEAVAAAAQLPAAEVRRAAMYVPSLGELARVALLEGSAGLARFELRLFSPVAPMLAQTAADVGEALRALGEAVAFEWKLDGARIQVHKSAQQVRIYTRALNEITDSLPEVVELVRALPASELILDGEAIAIDAAGRPRPFQITMRRFGRRLGVAALRGEIALRAFFFDCLRLEARTLTQQTTQQRFEALCASVPAEARVPRLLNADEPRAQAFYQAALDAGHEGVMAKALDAPYEAGNRGASWLKIKRAQTLDLVVLAAEWGHGRRRGWLSNLHLGAPEPGGDYVMLGKTFKGLTDELLAWQTAQLLAREVRRDATTVYVRPELVVEIAYSDLQESSRYAGGLALRLARVKRYRSDKQAAEADTMEVVRRLFAAQSGTPPPER